MLADHADENRLRADFVWLPAWGQSSSYDTAIGNMPNNPDPRARVWYDNDLVLGYGLADYMPSMDAPVFDMYLIYEAGGLWDDEGNDTPGEPTFMQHGHSQTFEADAFWDELEPLLPDCDEVISE
jgi:hypothetical protein